MKTKIPELSYVAHIFLLLILAVAFSKNIIGQDLFQERSVINDLVRIHGAQMTYSSTTGNGNYGALNQLLEDNLIDSVLASGDKYGYWFLLSFASGSVQNPPKFNILATPQRYGQTGRRSFYIDESGEIHGGDKKGHLAGLDDPYIDGCVVSGISDNERCTLNVLRSLHGAEMTYHSTTGNGNFGSLSQIVSSRLIGQNLSNGLRHGYKFSIILSRQSSESPADFKVSAIPEKYGITGIRSFFLGMDGVVRGADRKGKAATQNDPFFDFCLFGFIPDVEQCTFGTLRMLHYAQMSYVQITGKKSYGNLNELRAANLLDQSLESNLIRNYSVSLVTIPPTISTPAKFRITAVPQIYGKTGVRSFFIDETNIVRGGDKNGKPADENDTQINW